MVPVCLLPLALAYSLLGLSWVVAGSMREELWVWRGIKSDKCLINLIFLNTFWVIWKERNRETFEREEFSFDRYKDT